MQNLVRLLIIVLLAAVVGSLGSALYHLARGGDREASRKMVRALSFRVGLSLVLFFLLMLAWYVGLISPHGLAPQ